MAPKLWAINPSNNRGFCRRMIPIHTMTRWNRRRRMKIHNRLSFRTSSPSWHLRTNRNLHCIVGIPEAAATMEMAFYSNNISPGQVPAQEAAVPAVYALKVTSLSILSNADLVRNIAVGPMARAKNRVSAGMIGRHAPSTTA